jgi:hypothetical protein
MARYFSAHYPEIFRVGFENEIFQVILNGD